MLNISFLTVSLVFVPDLDDELLKLLTDVHVVPVQLLEARVPFLGIERRRHVGNGRLRANARALNELK
jgi:hypothetical protein